MKETILNQTFDEERALYGLRDTEVSACTFEGEADGESALKESRHVKIHNCRFALRYPLWHAEDVSLTDCHMTETARAPLWYTSRGTLRHCRLEAPKALRECKDTLIEGTVVHSTEFGWRCQDIKIRDSYLESDYLLFECRDLTISRLNMKGKYSFQYIENALVEDSVLDTKDAFWHAKNVTVRNCEVRGEYLGWYSDGLTLIDCRIIGTQPLCYCENLRLINCTMEETDLAFEYSHVEADIKGEILSVKNPRSGYVRADAIGEIIQSNSVMETDCIIEIKKGA